MHHHRSSSHILLIVILHALLPVLGANGVEESIAESVAIAPKRPNLHKVGAKVGPFLRSLVRVTILLALVDSTHDTHTILNMLQNSRTKSVISQDKIRTGLVRRQRGSPVVIRQHPRRQKSGSKMAMMWRLIV
jgi:hypothetical protein